MKYLNITIFTASLLIFLSACVDLVEEPKSFLAPEQFFKTKSQITAAVLGVYDIMNSDNLHGHVGMVAIGDGAADNINAPGTYFVTKQLNPPTINIDAGNNRILDFYADAYVAINRANALIDRVPESREVDNDFSLKIVAEAKFLRAYMYFNLVRVFGDVVYFENEAVSLSGLDAARTPASEVFNKIVGDLKFAEENLGDTGLDTGRAHKWAAKALLAKVYLTIGQYADAASKTQEIINSSKFQLIQEYNKLFRPENTTLTQEILFAIQYNTQNRSLLTDYLTPSEISSYGAFAADDSLFKASVYEVGDKRKEWTIYESIQYKGKSIRPTRLHFRKFAEDYLIDLVPESQTGYIDYPVLRYADVLLMNSEAIAKKDGNANSAYAGVNQVRQRAGLPPLQGLTQQQFLDKLLHERRVELVLEGHRWFDLKRFDKLVEVMDYYQGFDSHNVVFPIPSSALISNPNLTQNTGY